MNFRREAGVSRAKWKRYSMMKVEHYQEQKERQADVFMQVHVTRHYWKCKKMKLERQEGRLPCVQHDTSPTLD